MRSTAGSTMRSTTASSESLSPSALTITNTTNQSQSKCGLAQTQSAHHTPITTLFSPLDRLESHFSSTRADGPYFLGSTLTEADVRLYVTIIRFDPVYV